MPAGNGANILFIDDDAELVAALSVTLQREGYRVEHAADGDIGVRMAAKSRPDLIILDFMMPTMNGFDACCELRRIEHLRNVPILSLPAFGQNIGEIHGMNRGGANLIQDYLEKPVEPNVLLERIAEAIARARGAPV